VNTATIVTTHKCVAYNRIRFLYVCMTQEVYLILNANAQLHATKHLCGYRHNIIVLYIVSSYTIYKITQWIKNV